ncbi:MAG: ribonuclease P protein component [Bacilli bacterium]|nr:ribonuclease P protein component [Bacilli bacterium]
MKATNRIKKSEDFAFTIKKGTANRNKSFVVHIRKNEFGYARIGISVSSKLGHAVTRNRIKRQMRAMVFELVNLQQDSYDIVIVAKDGFLDRTYDENKALLAQLLTLQVGL